MCYVLQKDSGKLFEIYTISNCTFDYVYCTNIKLVININIVHSFDVIIDKV